MSTLGVELVYSGECGVEGGYIPVYSNLPGSTLPLFLILSFALYHL